MAHRRSPARPASRHIAMLAFPGAQMLDITGLLEVFSRAGRMISDEGRRGPLAYTVEVLARRAGPVVMSSGIEIVARRALAQVRGGIDTLLVAGGHDVPAARADRALIAWIARMGPRARRLASVCNGAFLVAEAGLLDGKRAVTHWECCAQLAAEFPRINVQTDPIFVRDGRVYSTAGVTAGIDLALALVEEDHGPQLARAVARDLVMFLQRPGGQSALLRFGTSSRFVRFAHRFAPAQSQFSAQLEVQLGDRAPLGELQAWMADHVGSDLSVAALARRVGMSARNFARVFTRDVGLTPARLVERLRVEAARRRLEQSDAGVDAIAFDCGFGTAESMRRAFLRILRVPPTAYRTRFAERAP